MTQTEVIANLKAARALISTPEKWTKGSWARDAQNGLVEAHSNKAVCFCAIGAVQRAAAPGNLISSRSLNALRETLIAQGQTGLFVHMYNDAPERTHNEVLELFDDTIERLEVQ